MVPMPPPFMSDDSDSNESGEKDWFLSYILMLITFDSMYGQWCFWRKWPWSFHYFLITSWNIFLPILKSRWLSYQAPCQPYILSTIPSLKSVLYPRGKPQPLFIQDDGASYNGYKLEGLPKPAWPDRNRKNGGMHSYTIHRGSARIEVLLRQRAFFVRARNVLGNQHISWSKYPSILDAWLAACARAGVLP